MASKDKGKTKDYGDYRQSVSTIDPILGSIGAIIHKGNLSDKKKQTIMVSQDKPLVPAHTIIPSQLFPLDGFDKYLGRLIDTLMIREGLPGIPQSRMPSLPADYKFKDCSNLALGTCFHLGYGYVATAGHCVFDLNPVTGRYTWKEWLLKNEQVDGDTSSYIVFGLTQQDIALGFIPSSKVFSIERICFGQHSPFDLPDRPDWAILKVRPTVAGSDLPAVSLRPFGDTQKIDSTWTAGHPWGIGLTVSKPPSNDGSCLHAGLHSLSHNMIVAPANSGSPIFNAAGEVIAVVASGLGEDMFARGFNWLLPGKGGPPNPIITPDPTNSFVIAKFRGSKVDDFSPLARPHAVLVLACQVPDAPGVKSQPAGDKLTVNLIYDRIADNSSQIQTLVDGFNIPANRVVQLAVPLATAGLDTQPWQLGIRAFEFKYIPAAAWTPTTANPSSSLLSKAPATTLTPTTGTNPTVGTPQASGTASSAIKIGSGERAAASGGPSTSQSTVAGSKAAQDVPSNTSSSASKDAGQPASIAGSTGGTNVNPNMHPAPATVTGAASTGAEEGQASGRNEAVPGSRGRKRQMILNTNTRKFQSGELVIGCFTAGDGRFPQRWRMLYKGVGPVMEENAEVPHVLPMFLDSAWNQVDANGMMGVLNTRAVGLQNL